MENSDMPATGLSVPMSDVAKQQAAAAGWAQEPTVYLGLTKREAFAMAAMQGLCACLDERSKDNLLSFPPNYSYSESLAETATILADALLSALENTTDNETREGK